MEEAYTGNTEFKLSGGVTYGSHKTSPEWTTWKLSGKFSGGTQQPSVE